jgi:CheY-like chemotaxis protein
MVNRFHPNGAHPPLSASSRLVLIVEDDEDVRDAIAELLRELGHLVLSASSGAGAVEVLERAVPNLVLLDLGLADQDGCTLAAAMRASFGPHVRLVALTGYSGTDVRERARIAGFDAFLTKPVTCDELQKQVLSAPVEISK